MFPCGARHYNSFPVGNSKSPQRTPTQQATRSETGVLLAARGLRAFADGYVAILLPVYLLQQGFDALAVGVLSTATLLGSAALTLSVGTIAHRFDRRTLLLFASLLMILTGIGFAVTDSFWLLLVIAFVGTLNPSAGDVSIFLPLEHSRLAESVSGAERTALFARYSLIGSLVGAIGSLAAAAPDAIAGLGIDPVTTVRAMFLLYAALGAAVMLLYRTLPARATSGDARSAGPLGPSRRIVLRMAALFSLDSFGGGFIVQSLLALWLFQRFGLSLSEAGTFFFWTGVLTSLSYLLAVRIARRFGLVNTMVFTHLPSSFCLIAVAFVDDLYSALALLLVRSVLSQMDVPTRTSYVMAVVTPAERAAAASITAVPRSLAAAASPALAGWLFGISVFAWPLVLGGGLKIVYDLLLLAQFRRIRPPEEDEAESPTP
jgi:MFS family permease